MRSVTVAGAWVVVVGMTGAAAAETAASPAPPGEPAPATVEAAPRPHDRTGTSLGLAGTAAFGLTASYGGSLWLEHAIAADNTLIARVTYVRGYGLEAEDDGFDAVTLHLGDRWFWGGFYATLELGAFAARERAFFDTMDDAHVEGDWDAFFSASAGIGGKLGRVDLGLTAHFPLMAIGAHLGFDFATW